MKKRIIGFVISILVFIAAFILPVGTGLSLLMMIVGMFATIAFGIRILVNRGAMPQFEGDTRLNGQRKEKRVALEKIDTTNVWDEITQNTDE